MIRWDSLLARHVARELDALLTGARLRALRLDGAARDLVLLLRDRVLLWRLHPTRGHLRLLPPLEPTAGDLAVKARIAGVSAVPDDRVIRFALTPSRSGRPPQSLVVELLSNQWNALLTEGEPGAPEPEIVRHVLWRREGARGPRVGHPYRAPPPLGRKGVDGVVSAEEWTAVLEPLPPTDRSRALVKTFAWTSPLNAVALLGAEGHGLWTRLADADAVAQPVILETEHGLQPYPFPLPGTPRRPADSLLDAIDACRPGAGDDAVGVGGVAHGAADESVGPGGLAGAAADHARAVAGVGPELMRRLEGAARRSARREERLEAQLATLEDPERLRRIGDLILARYREIPSGVASARLSGFDGEEHEVELDPAEPPHENAARYYGRAGKAERARERLPRLLGEAREERSRLEALVEAARTGAVDEDAVRKVLGPDQPTERGQVTGPALPYRAYRSSGGLEIRVGRGARHNDDLTFRHSSPDDVWLHARDSAGAHVVLRWPGPGNPPARDLAEAATLAALHSRARTSGSAPVDWTLRKHVRKPRKSPPGRVVADRVETLFVEPSEALLERLERLR